MNISSNFDQNISRFHEILDVQKNFDIVYHTLTIADKKACLYFIDGFTKDEILLRLMQDFASVKPDSFPSSAHDFAKQYVHYGETTVETDDKNIFTQLLSGLSCLLIDGYDRAILIDCRTYPSRSIEEPDKDKSLRGSRDGFVETIVFNTALMRRRIRDPHLIMEMYEAGTSTRTDVALCYMSDRVDRELLTTIQNKLEESKSQDLKMSQQSLAESLFQRKWYNPFPKYKFTERPDTACACLMEGKVIILTDTSPSALILPTSIFDMIEEANDYYFPPITGIYLKISRVLISLLTVFMVPLFLLFMQNPAWIPEIFRFVLIEDTVNIPLIFQILILELAIDGLRLAALNTPSMLSTPLSVIAGIVMGEFSVESGWFNSETMLYMAFVTVANYSQASFELGYAMKFMRIIILICTAIFNIWGFVIGIIFSFCAIIFNRTIAGKSYIYPLIPFHLNELKKRFLRGRLPHKLEEDEN